MLKVKKCHFSSLQTILKCRDDTDQCTDLSTYLCQRSVFDHKFVCYILSLLLGIIVSIIEILSQSHSPFPFRYTLRDVSYNARWFWTTIRYGPMTTAYLCWTTGNGFKMTDLGFWTTVERGNTHRRRRN